MCLTNVLLLRAGRLGSCVTGRFSAGKFGVPLVYAAVATLRHEMCMPRNPLLENALGKLCVCESEKYLLCRSFGERESSRCKLT